MQYHMVSKLILCAGIYRVKDCHCDFLRELDGSLCKIRSAANSRVSVGQRVTWRSGKVADCTSVTQDLVFTDDDVAIHDGLVPQ